MYSIRVKTKLQQSNLYVVITLGFTGLKGMVSPAERCDLVGVKLEKVHELFQVCKHLLEISDVS